VPRTTTLIIGAGQAGLAMSRCLSELGIDHVVLERGKLAQRWRSQSWDSLRLLTPNWMTRLPRFQYDGSDPNGFMSIPELIAFFERYAAESQAPIVTDTAVQSVERSVGGFRIVTDRDEWSASSVVVATGYSDRPAIPAVSRGLSPSVLQVAAIDYRRPEQLPAGGVLVVGASATGVQLAWELAQAGRDVVLAVGNHSRVPRSYRGMDIFWWLESTGRLGRTIDDMPDAAAARREPSMQLAGRSVGEAVESDVDLAALQRRGVRLTGRLRTLEGGIATFDQDLAALTSAADRRMHRVLDSVDRYVDRAGLGREVLAPVRPADVPSPVSPSRLDLPAEGIRTVILATGFRPDFPWIEIPVLAPDGSIRQRRGWTEAPGVAVIGQPFQHRRDSAVIDGARHDAAHIVARLTRDDRAAAAARPHGEDLA
jgi:putative flavoprotein involved in K+ transport